MGTQKTCAGRMVAVKLSSQCRPRSLGGWKAGPSRLTNAIPKPSVASSPVSTAIKWQYFAGISPEI